jgi:glycine cleavage system H protein
LLNSFGLYFNYHNAILLFLEEKNMNTPTELKYTKADEWLRIDGDRITLGITDYAQNHLSDLVYCGLKAEKGSSISKGDLVVEIDSVKASAEVNSPVSGKVVEVNQEVMNSPEIINDDPYGKGWFYAIEMTNSAELSELLTAEEYEQYCDSRGS